MGRSLLDLLGTLFGLKKTAKKNAVEKQKKEPKQKVYNKRTGGKKVEDEVRWKPVSRISPKEEVTRIDDDRPKKTISKAVAQKSEQKKATEKQYLFSKEPQESAPQKKIIQEKQTVSSRKNNPPRQEEQVIAPRAESVETPYTLYVTGKITPDFTLVRIEKKQSLLSLPTKMSLQVNNSDKSDEREVNIGLDFGTSSVKVVIGDPVLKKAFAVPFFGGTGLEQYLLPSRVWKEDGSFSFTGNGEPLRDLKLQLTKETCPSGMFETTASFLALVFRHARNWLLTEHRDIYERVEILWKVTLGLPAENYNNGILVERFTKLAAAAWLVSLSEDAVIDEEIAADICQKIMRARSLTNLHDIKGLQAVELDVVPELSAQIYGFLESDRFDPKAKNVFMIVDVGAGTVDSSIFHVNQGRAKKLDFTFYANKVEFNGVANLNSYRVEWLKDVFQEAGLKDEVITQFLEQIHKPTDFMTAIPESIHDYFSGVDIEFKSSEDGPDNDFFNNRFKKQVLLHTLKKASEKVASRSHFEDMPVFVCGGGSRMRYYRELENELLYHPNASWFHFVPRKLAVPDILDVPGVVQDDFDRLSVAFGLSFVNVGKTIREQEVMQV